MLKIVSVDAYPIRLPLSGAFTTAKGRTLRSHTVIIKITLDSGVTGLGEATPVRYVTGESFRSLGPALRSARCLLINTDPADWRRTSLLLERALPQAHTARAGIEMALVDATARSVDQPAYRYLGGNEPCAVVTDQTISVVSPAEATNDARVTIERFRGTCRFKIKVDGGGGDLQRILAVALAAPGSDIKIDANQAFTPKGAVEFIDSLAKAGVTPSLLEQPVDKHDIDGLKYVTENVSVPVFADESVLTADDARILVDRGAVKGINVKLMKSGIRGALEIAKICRQAGLGLMLGCMLESKIGLSASLHVASATGAFEHFDLDSDELISSQPVEGGFERQGDRLTLLDRPGLGCELTLSKTQLLVSSALGFYLP